MNVAHYLNTQALILSSRPRGDYDMWVSLASPDFGLTQAKMTGVRRPRSRLKALKEPGVFADIQLYGKIGQANPLTLLTGKVIDDFAGLRRDFNALKSSLDLLRFAEAFLTPFDSRADDKLNLLLDALRGLSQSNAQDIVGRILAVAKVQILNLSGWRFGLSDVAKTALSPSLLSFCETLEMNNDCVSQEQDYNKLNYFIDLYAGELLAR